MEKELFRVGGLHASSSLYFIAQHFESGIIVLPGSADLHLARDTLKFFLPPATKIHLYPFFERVYEPVRQEPLALFERLETQIDLSSQKNQKAFVLTTREALSQMTISPDELLQSIVRVEKNKWLERDSLILDLQNLGYRRDDLAEDQGFFSVRGHLLDIFSPYELQPFRIEFFGDEIVSIRSFDPDTQRSLAELSSIQIYPCREILLTSEKWKRAKEKLKNLGDEKGIPREERERLLSDLEAQKDIVEPRWLLPAFATKLVSAREYFPSSFTLIFVDTEKSQSEFQEFIRDEDKAYQELTKLAYGPEALRLSLEDLDSAPHHELSTNISPKGMNYQVLGLEGLRNKLLQSKSFVPLAEEIRKWRDDSLKIEILYQSEKRREAILDSIPHISQDVTWREGPPFEGFSSPTFQHVFVTERDIFGIRKKRSSSAARSATEFLRQFSDLKDGDYVIHDDHGIGKFRGLQKLEVQGVTSEFLLLEYAENDKLYLPIYRVDKINRYVSEGYATPRLDRLGSQAFAKRKAKIRKDIFKMAHELLEIAAARKLKKVERPQSIDEAAYRQFCDLFPYELTPDQEAAIVEVERDLRQNHPMDRLVCGDVGFGKTEVALRAAMLSLLQGKQVAVLAPTTILVEQHFRNFKKRFQDFKFNVVRVSRFVSPQEQKKILQDLRAGKIHVMIGTHRLLQPDIHFENLGLLIVDEEQRFGVKHKERLKKVRSTSDVLTLSATPIPRTLQMAIFGIRELSLIATPPENREAVKTFVGVFDEHLIRNACLKELQRGGQILFVHNRVKSIQALSERIQRLLPEARIVVAHGQMNEHELEEKMIRFLENKADLLISTSIIENGLDIANANTLFVDRAELFGLSDLYQLRGRVGRSYRSSFSYFLIHEDTVLTDEASKRLQVIQSCTALGSGFHVATHDMEIRGSGNLLGEEQSGIIAEVGLEMYSQMLQETLAELKHTGIAAPHPELSSGYTAYVPETYIPDASIRIDTYKRLNKVRTPAELLQIEDELLDRFGLAPRELENLSQLLRLRTLAEALKAQSIDVFPGKLAVLLDANTPLSPEKVLPLLNKEMTLDPKGRISFSFKSALKDPKLAEKSQFKSHPELYDFSVCRNFLKMLCEKAGVGLESV